MESMFDELFGIDGVQGVFLISCEGKTVFNRFRSPTGKTEPEKPVEMVGQTINIEKFTETLEQANESLLIYTQKRIYIKKAGEHFLFILLDMFAPVAMVRLNCQLIIPELEKIKSSKGIGRFFRK